ncbi:hypothetical protein AALB47_22970 [Lachnospiraceae bacterium 54-11]
MKRNLKIVVGCLITMGLFFFILNCTDALLERKAGVKKNEDFFQQEGNYDVLFMGTSHVLNSIFPMELWNDYGIVSYNFGGHGNEMATTYWVMMNALDYTKPKLMVIDCMMLSSNEKLCGDFDYVHLSFDAFPLSKNKILAVDDLWGNSAKKWDLLWDFTVYHNRWSDLTREDFEAVPSLEKGAESRIGVAVPASIGRIEQSRVIEKETVGEEYLRKMIEECQKRGIGVLLTYLPFPANAEEQLEAEMVYDIAEEYGVGYINFLEMNVVNYQTDCFDAVSHLNPSGAKKVTDYLGEYISANYPDMNQKDNVQYSEWHDDYALYKNFKLQMLKEQTEVQNYLMLLADKGYNVYIEMSDHMILKDEICCQLLYNLGIKTDLVGEDINYITIESANIKYEALPGKDYLENTNEPYLKIRVFDRETQQLADEVNFTYTYSQKLTTTGVYRS